jgi:hypothetical protein
MSFPIDGNAVSGSEFAADINTIQIETAWDDASDSELEARITKDSSGSYGGAYC